MKLQNPEAEIFFPESGFSIEDLPATTHLAIGAHPDDIEIMAVHGIWECYSAQRRSFTAVTCCHGASCPRTGNYAHFSDEEMRAVRRQEQRRAASLGRYLALFQLDYSGSQLRSLAVNSLIKDLTEILRASRPHIVYTHNPADKHDTHVAVTLAALHALRNLPQNLRPEKIYGCEVWRSLDWLPDKDKVLLDVSGAAALAETLLGVYQSQTSSGKRYDLAVLGRRRANATFYNFNEVDRSQELCFAMDLTPLVNTNDFNIAKYLKAYLDHFSAEILSLVSTKDQK